MIPYLTFSDSAKYAQAAKHLIEGRGLTVSHSFFDITKLINYTPNTFWDAGFLPLPSWVLATVFRFLPITDGAVIATGLAIYLLLLIGVYLLANRFGGKIAAITAVIFTLSNFYLWEYATNSSSEIFFAAEIIWFLHLWLSKKLMRPLSLFMIGLMVLTRQQAFVVIITFLATVVSFAWGKKNGKNRQLSWFIFLVVTIIFLVGRLDVSSKFSPFRAMYLALMHSTLSPSSYLRGIELSFDVSVKALAAKCFYNFYNFLRDPARLINPLVLGLFILYKPTKDEAPLFFRNFSYFGSILFILAASLSLPNARYIHPITPLLAIGAGCFIAETFKQNKRLPAVLLVFFATLPFLGHLTVDQRTYSKLYNSNRPPATRVISSTIADYIPQGKLIITNFDAWAAWYEGLSTMWFPLSPSQLKGFENHVDYIVLTDYNTQNEDFALGEWQSVFDHPDGIKDEAPFSKFELLAKLEIRPEQVREKRTYKLVILRQRNENTK